METISYIGLDLEYEKDLFLRVGHMVKGCRPFHNFLITILPKLEKIGYIVIDFI